MRLRPFLLPFALALVTPFAGPAHAAPACVVLNWRNGDWCTFEAPTRAFVFGGVATGVPDGGLAWVAVQVSFQGQVIASCYGTAPQPGYPATCEGNAQAFAPTLLHVCQVFGTGGPKFHCADPPALPLPLPQVGSR